MKIIIIFILTLTSTSTFANQHSNDISNFGAPLMFGGLFILMYFLLIRPQTKKAKEHKKLIDNLKINNEIITNSGFLGKIIKITDQFATILISNNVEVVIQKEAISSILPKGTIKDLK